MMRSPSETVLVTGGAGFIGSHVVDRLLAQGREVVVVDDLSSGKRENLARHADDRRLRLIVADLREDFAAALTGVRPAAVIHLAAQVSVPRSIEDPVGDLDMNLRASVRVLQWGAGWHAEVSLGEGCAARSRGWAEELGVSRRRAGV